MLNVGQLSLVDFAGSERNSRTKTTGERLREAGSIDNTLSVPLQFGRRSAAKSFATVVN